MKSKPNPIQSDVDGCEVAKRRKINFNSDVDGCDNSTPTQDDATRERDAEKTRWCVNNNIYNLLDQHTHLRKEDYLRANINNGFVYDANCRHVDVANCDDSTTRIECATRARTRGCGARARGIRCEFGYY